MLYNNITYTQIYIDQSGKVEETGKPTVVAYSNGKHKSLYISSGDKQEIQQVFREGGKPDMFIYRTFGILIFLLIENDMKNISSIIIDTEYLGYEHLIKDTLMQLIKRRKKDFDSDAIHFKQVGKNHRCHEVAIKTYRGELPKDIIVNLTRILEFLL